MKKTITIEVPDNTDMMSVLNRMADNMPVGSMLIESEA